MSYQHRYRLPTSLGGHEYPGVPDEGLVRLTLPDNRTLELPADILTRVVPEEPEEGSFVAVLRPEPDTAPLVWVRLARDGEEPAGRPHWWSYDQQCWHIWEQVYMLGTPRLLTFGGKLLRGAGARGWCCFCETSQPLRTDDRLKIHGSKRYRCPGSQGKPNTPRPAGQEKY